MVGWGGGGGGGGGGEERRILATCCSLLATLRKGTKEAARIGRLGSRTEVMGIGVQQQDTGPLGSTLLAHFEGRGITQ